MSCVWNAESGQLEVNNIKVLAKWQWSGFNRLSSAEFTLRTKSRQSVIEPPPAVPWLTRVEWLNRNWSSFWGHCVTSKAIRSLLKPNCLTQDQHSTVTEWHLIVTKLAFLMAYGEAWISVSWLSNVRTLSSRLLKFNLIYRDSISLKLMTLVIQHEQKITNHSFLMMIHMSKAADSHFLPNLKRMQVLQADCRG